jgi:hypothetical protein
LAAVSAFQAAQRIPSKVVRSIGPTPGTPGCFRRSVACAQLEYQVYIVAKRKDGRGLLQWVLANPEQFFSRYCCWLERHGRSDRKLMRLVARARRLWTQRNGYVHALWATRRGRPVRRRKFENAGISISRIEQLVRAVQKVRDDLERHVPA